MSVASTELFGATVAAVALAAGALSVLPPGAFIAGAATCFSADFAFSAICARAGAGRFCACFAGTALAGAFGPFTVGTLRAEEDTVALDAARRAEVLAAACDVTSAVLAVRFSLVFAAVLAAALVRVAEAVPAPPEAFVVDTVFPVAVLLLAAPFVVDDFLASDGLAWLVFAATLDREVFDAPPEAEGASVDATPRVRAAFEEAFFTDPDERSDAVTLPAPFDFSLFLADGIRRLLPWRPAVETGRISKTTFTPVPQRPYAGVGANGSQNTLAGAIARRRAPKAAFCLGARFLFCREANSVAGTPINRRDDDLIDIYHAAAQKSKATAAARRRPRP